MTHNYTYANRANVVEQLAQEVKRRNSNQKLAGLRYNSRTGNAMLCSVKGLYAYFPLRPSSPPANCGGPAKVL